MYSRDNDQFIHIGVVAIKKRIKPEWLSESVKSLIRNSNPTDSILPYIADALEEAGCTNDKLLEHLRCAHIGMPLGSCDVVTALREMML